MWRKKEKKGKKQIIEGKLKNNSLKTKLTLQEQLQAMDQDAKKHKKKEWRRKSFLYKKILGLQKVPIGMQRLHAPNSILTLFWMFKKNFNLDLGKRSNLT
jgi:hypothetical protein